MKRTITCILILMLGFSSYLYADGMIVTPADLKAEFNYLIHEPEQKAIIFHDGQKEQLVLQVKYEGDVEEFGWIVPVPAYPEVEKSDDKLFVEIATFFYNLEKEAQKRERKKGPQGMGGAALGEDDEKGTRERPVSVLEKKKVGLYDVTILAATDPDALQQWLQKNNFVLPRGEEVKEILQYYIDKKMYFIAMKIDAKGRYKKKKLSEKLANGIIQPISISFESPDIFYPLRITAAHMQKDKSTRVVLHIFSKKDSLSYTGTSRLADKDMKGHAHEYTFKRKHLNRCYRAFKGLSKGNYVLTHYAKSFRKDNMRSDLVFSTSGEDMDNQTAENLYQTAMKEIKLAPQLTGQQQRQKAWWDIYKSLKTIVKKYPNTTRARDAEQKLASVDMKEVNAYTDTAYKSELRAAEGEASRRRWRLAIEHLDFLKELFPDKKEEIQAAIQKAKDKAFNYLLAQWDDYHKHMEEAKESKDYRMVYYTLTELILVTQDKYKYCNIPDSLPEKAAYGEKALKALRKLKKAFSKAMKKKRKEILDEVDWFRYRNPRRSIEYCYQLVYCHPKSSEASKAKKFLKELGVELN